MIKLEKGLEPDILIRESANWTAILQVKIANGEKPTDNEVGKYRHPQIKSALIEETHGKCAYCESKFRHVSFGDVEHVVPKSKAVALTFEWSNLTLACQICNNKKSNSINVIDPYVEDPKRHIHFEGPTLFPVPGSDLGFHTERDLDLNRVELLEARKARRDNLYIIAEAAAKNTDERKRAVLLKILETEMNSNKEFSAMCSELVPRYVAFVKSAK